MAPTISDTHLWVGLAILGWCSALLIHKQLALIRTTSEVPNSPSRASDKVNQQTQDGTILSPSQSSHMAKSASSAIKLSTLSQLLQSTSSEIRDATTKIVAERALQSPTAWRLLRRQLRSKMDLKARDQALCILVQFGPGSSYDARMRRDDSRDIEYNEFFHPATFVAAIACLCNMLPAAQQAEELGQHHDSAEANALWFVHKLVENDISLALKAGLVRKWLVNYPLNARSPEKTKKEVIRDIIKAYEYDDDYERLLCCVLHDMTEKAEARRQMERYGIGDPGYVYDMLKYHNGRSWGVRHYYPNPSIPERRFGEGNDGRGVGEDHEAASALLMDIGRAHDALRARGEAIMARIAGDDSTGAGRLVMNDEDSIWGRDNQVLRRREESDEERALRSRRREAMVFAEGGGPIRREDIIESQREEIVDEFVGEEITDEMVEEELEQLIEEMGEQMDRRMNENTGEGQGTWLGYLMGLRPDGSVTR